MTSEVHWERRSPPPTGWSVAMKDSKIPGSMDSGVFGGSWAPKAVELSLSAAV